jgi:PhzF family phenazine biosynthesis protein
MPTVPLFHVDAFTSAAFRGNPAAVCLLAGPKPGRWLQAVAAEMNLSETAFVQPTARGFRLRWFTPKVEVDLCGHATLAAAHVLWTEGLAPGGATLRFATRSGELTAVRRGVAIELDFPARAALPCTAPAGLRQALGAPWRHVARNVDDYLVELRDEAAVRELEPDFAALAKLPVRGVMVTAAGRRGFDFVSRFFAPRVGLPEDPVTGSAHTALGPFWSARLGRTTLRGFQASARGGVVEVVIRGERTLLRGDAVTVVRGQLVT